MTYPITFNKMCKVWFADTPVARHRMCSSFERLCVDLLEVQPVDVPRGDQTWPVITHVMPIKIVSADHPCGALFTYEGEFYSTAAYTYDAINKLLCEWPLSFVQEIHTVFNTLDFKIAI